MATYDRTADEKLGKDLARKRLCEEFVFVLLQLATNKVEQSELDMAKCSARAPGAAPPERRARGGLVYYRYDLDRNLCAEKTEAPNVF